VARYPPCLTHCETDSVAARPKVSHHPVGNLVHSDTLDAVDAPDVIGRDLLVPKHSAVDGEGRWRVNPIEGLRFRPTRPIPHEDGTLAEVARRSWPEIDDEIVQVHVTTTQPGRVRAWGLHRASSDRLFVVTGLVSLVAFDGRRDSPTRGVLNEFKVSERSPGLLVIPANVYHGWKNIGTVEAFIVNMPTEQYEYEAPDALDLPYDAPEAASVVPFRW
jgi:dTDP-4-dehydrorhamnose 3,5-epimerase